jgi:hypothetical protein
VGFAGTTSTSIIRVQDGSIIGNGTSPQDGFNITRDKSTGLDWLDLTLSTNRSFSDVVAQLGDGEDYQGFRVATDVEIGGLFLSAGAPSINGSGVSYNAAAELLINAVGTTQVFGAGPAGSGFRNPNVAPTGYRSISAYTDFNPPFANPGIFVAAGWDLDTASPNYGTWLVRNTSDVTPAPSGTVAGLNGVTTNGGGIILSTHSPLTINDPVVDTGNGDIALVAGNDGGDDDDLTINASVQSTGGDVELTAGTDLAIQQGSGDPVIIAAGGTIAASAERSAEISGEVQLAAVSPAIFDTPTITVLGTANSDQISFIPGPGVGDVEIFLNGISLGIVQSASELNANGGDGDDVIVVDPAVSLSTVLDGGGGNDQLTGGTGNNTLIGGDGDDTLQDGGGTNTVIGGGGSNTFVPGGGTNTFESEPGSTAPEVFADTYATTEDTQLTVAMEFGVLSNDLDPNGAALTATLVTPPIHGIVTLNPDGSFSYDPADNFYGTDRFIYVSSNGTSTSSEASVEIAITPVNDAPANVRIDSIGNGSSVFPIGPISLLGSFLDVDVDDAEHTANWTLTHSAGTGIDVDIVIGTVNSATQTVSDVVNFATATLGPGVYTLTLAVDDGNGGIGVSNPEIFVVYDPSEGFVTGGGWINSPAGAYTADPSLTGKATFGFVSKYQKGASVPTGQTEFQFKVANLNFHSTSYQWLVVAGARAKYKGEGKINGTGNYGFMLTAIDGQVNGGGGVDKFRIKIWDTNNGDAIVYDNQIGASDDAAPSTTLGGGQIVIHKNGNNLTATSSGWTANGVVLTQPMLNAAVAEATVRWREAGVGQRRLAAISIIDVEPAQFSGATLGLASSSTNKIWLDTDGAGHGWSTDIYGDGYDLVSAVSHEIGHALGFDHDVLGASLEPRPIHLPADHLAFGYNRGLPNLGRHDYQPVNALDAVFDGVANSSRGSRLPRSAYRFDQWPTTVDDLERHGSQNEASRIIAIDSLFGALDDVVRDELSTAAVSPTDDDAATSTIKRRGSARRILVDADRAELPV